MVPREARNGGGVARAVNPRIVVRKERLESEGGRVREFEPARVIRAGVATLVSGDGDVRVEGDEGVEPGGEACVGEVGDEPDDWGCAGFDVSGLKQKERQRAAGRRGGGCSRTMSSSSIALTVTPALS